MATNCILVLSSNPQILRLTSLLLRKAGYWVRTEKEVEKGFKILLEESVDLLLLDLDIPEFDAYEFLRKLGKQQKNAVMPLVFSKRSKSQVNEQYTRYFLYSTFGFILSPFTKSELLNRCDQILKLRGNMGF